MSTSGTKLRIRMRKFYTKKQQEEKYKRILETPIDKVEIRKKKKLDWNLIGCSLVLFIILINIFFMVELYGGK
mgnify:CR=1 FL=1